MEQTEENRAGSPKSSNPVQGFKFIIILNNLTLNLKESIDCVIQYSFLNHPNETSGPAFTIDHPGVKGKEIPNLGFKEFKLHDLHRKPEMIEILESQPLEIKVSNGSKIGHLDICIKPRFCYNCLNIILFVSIKSDKGQNK